MEYICVLLALFGIKHFICDFVLQNNRMLSDKGTYMAPGGLTHAGEHAIGTIIVLFLVFPWQFEAHIVAVVLGIIDGIAHYHVDWAKTKLSQGLTANDRKFWIWFGADQALHYLTYIGIIAILVI